MKLGLLVEEYNVVVNPLHISIGPAGVTNTDNIGITLTIVVTVESQP